MTRPACTLCLLLSLACLQGCAAARTETGFYPLLQVSGDLTPQRRGELEAFCQVLAQTMYSGMKTTLECGSADRIRQASYRALLQAKPSFMTSEFVHGVVDAELDADSVRSHQAMTDLVAQGEHGFRQSASASCRDTFISMWSEAAAARR